MPCLPWRMPKASAYGLILLVLVPAVVRCRDPETVVSGAHGNIVSDGLPAVPPSGQDGPILYADNLCGPNCLGVIAAYFGKPVDQGSLLKLTGGSLDSPVSMGDLARAAGALGISAQGGKATVRGLRSLPTPLIAHWRVDDSGHFVIVAGHRPGAFRVLDPPAGPRDVTDEEFSRLFTGYVLLLSPRSLSGEG